MDMNRIEKAVHAIHYLDSLGTQNKWINQIHPVGKLLVSMLYITLVVSFDKYDVVGLAGMSVYLIIFVGLSGVSLRRSLQQMKPVLLLICFVGIWNPFFDHMEVGQVGGFIITGGMVSMITLIMKGIFSVVSAYLLIATTSIEGICYALRKFHIPRDFVTVILLIYRYVIVLLKEVNRMTSAYQLRAPNQKGIHIKVWGSFVGQLLLRSIDRAQIVYESMLLRGYRGEFIQWHSTLGLRQNILYVVLLSLINLAFRIWPIFILVGNLIV